MRIAKTRLYQMPVLSMKACTKPLARSPCAQLRSVIGSIMIVCAKMIGMTLAALTFSGMYWRAPPYCLFPTTRLAYCTGTRRVPWTSRIAPAMTASRKTISKRNHTSPPAPPEARVPHSASTAPGRRAMIPIMMIRDTPLPRPLSVIRSPSQRTNILPAAMTTIA